MYDIIHIPSENKGSRFNNEPIALILHSIGLDIDKALKVLCLGSYKSSAHYFIPQISAEEFGIIYPQYINKLKYPKAVPVISLVEEQYSAFHAGISSWKNWNSYAYCEKSLNNCSIGIEFHSPGYGKNNGDMFYFTPYSKEQITTGKYLIRDIIARNNIKKANILAHSDISPLREIVSLGMHTYDLFKTDPGPLFPWKELATEGIGYYPEIEKDSFNKPNNIIEYVQQRLLNIGYSCPQSKILDIKTKYCINAYKMHFMSAKWKSFDSSIDDELINNLYWHYE